MKRKLRGSYSIEATIVISTILIALCAAMYAFMIMYQNVVVIYAASYGAQQGARAWVNTGIKIDGTERNYNSEVYYDITEIFGGGGVAVKKEKIEKAVEDKLKMSVFSAKDAEIKVDFDNYILYKRVTVEINQKIPIPFSGIVKFFNNNETFAITAKIEAAVTEPTDYIRNIDYAVEWIKFAGEKMSKSDNNIVSSVGKVLKGLK